MINSIGEKLGESLNEVLSVLPENEQKDYREYFNNYVRLMGEGREVEAEALTNKFKKKYGS